MARKTSSKKRTASEAAVLAQASVFESPAEEAQVAGEAQALVVRPQNKEPLQSTTNKRSKTEATLSTRWQSPLPAEIWVQISSCMGLSDKAALALTCHFLYDQIGKAALSELRRPSQHVEKLKFLFHAHELFPSKTLCTGCLTYHTNLSLQREARNYPNSSYDNDSERFKITAERSFSWSELHNIVSDVFCKRGRPQCLEIPPWNENPKAEAIHVWYLWAWLAIYEGRALLCVQYDRDVTVDVLQKPMATKLPQLCNHCLDAPALFAGVKDMVDELPRPWEDQETGIVLRSAARGCAFCATEYVLETKKIEAAEERAEKRAAYTIRLSRLVDLGECRTPHSRGWVSAIGKVQPGVLEDVPYDLEGRRSIIDRWQAVIDGHSEAHMPKLPIMDPDEEVEALLTVETYHHLEKTDTPLTPRLDA